MAFLKIVFCQSYPYNNKPVFFSHPQVPYSTPSRAMLKTTMGMLGEYEYDTVYNDHAVPPVTWFLYVTFLVTNCIIIMNLLVSNITDNVVWLID